jgi:hypothetical protein
MFLRLLFSTVRLLVLVIAFTLLFVGAKMILVGNPEWVQLELLNRDFLAASDPEANLALTEELLGEIDLLALELVGISALVNFFWVVFASMKSIDRPGVAKNFAWVWFLGLAVGIVASMTVSAYFVIEITDLVTKSKRFLFPVMGGLAFVVGYTIFGTFFTTSRMMKPAVPVISAIQRLR